MLSDSTNAKEGDKILEEKFIFCNLFVFINTAAYVVV